MQRQKAKELPATYFGYIHYCTEININLLLNTRSFHHKFRFIFSLNLYENMQNVHFREAKFKNSPGSMPPDSTPLVYSILFCRTNSELLPPGLLLPMGNTQYNITYPKYTKRCFLLTVGKGCTFRIIQRQESITRSVYLTHDCVLGL